MTGFLALISLPDSYRAPFLLDLAARLSLIEKRGRGPRRAVFSPGSDYTAGCVTPGHTFSRRIVRIRRFLRMHLRDHGYLTRLRGRRNTANPRVRSFRDKPLLDRGGGRHERAGFTRHTDCLTTPLRPSPRGGGDLSPKQARPSPPRRDLHLSPGRFEGGILFKAKALRPEDID